MTLRLFVGLVWVLVVSGCRAPGIRVAAKERLLEADDGFRLVSYRLDAQGPVQAGGPNRAAVIYITGSEDRSVLASTERLAGLCAMGMPVFALERRGVTHEGLTDPAAAAAGCTKPRRVADNLRLVEEVSRQVPADLPLIMIGASEGGDVAAGVAAGSARVTHVILIGCGGGWTQADELRHLVRSHPGALGLASVEELDAGLAQVRARPDADDQWLGHPFRRWSTFAFTKIADDVDRVKAPVLLLHGDRDESVPVESARALADGRPGVTYIEYPGLNHQFAGADGRSGFPRVEVDVITWLAAHGVLKKEESEAFAARVRATHPGEFASADGPKPTTPMDKDR